MLAAKNFKAYWGKDFHNTGTRRVNEEYFSVENCYGTDDIAQIGALTVGQTWKSPHYGSAHTVTRVS